MRREEYLTQYDSIVGDEKKLWFIASRFSSLMEIDRRTGRLVMLMDLSLCGKYRSLIKANDELIIVPDTSTELVTYNIVTKKKKRTSVPTNLYLENKNWSAKYICYDQFVFFNWSSPIIIKYDIKSEEWTTYGEWRDFLPNSFVADNWFPNEPFVCDRKVFFQVGNSEHLIIFDLSVDRIEHKRLVFKDTLSEVKIMDFTDGILYLQGKDKNNRIKLFQCSDFEGLKCNPINVYPDNNSLDKDYSIIKKMGKSLFLIPGKGDCFCSVDINKGTISYENLIPVVDKNTLREDWFSSFNYYRGTRINNQFVTLHSWTHSMITINDDGEVSNVPLIYGDEVVNKLLESTFKLNGLLKENEFELSDLLNYI